MRRGLHAQRPLDRGDRLLVAASRALLVGEAVEQEGGGRAAWHQPDAPQISPLGLRISAKFSQCVGQIVEHHAAIAEVRLAQRGVKGAGRLCEAVLAVHRIAKLKVAVTEGGNQPNGGAQTLLQHRHAAARVCQRSKLKV